MAKNRAAVMAPARRKLKVHKKVKTKEDRFDDFSFNNHNEDEEGPNWYHDEDAIRRIESIRPQSDWDEEDGFSAWWNWGN